MNDNLPTNDDDADRTVSVDDRLVELSQAAADQRPRAIVALTGRIRSLRGRSVAEINAELTALVNALDEIVTAVIAELIVDAVELGKELERDRARRERERRQTGNVTDGGNQPAPGSMGDPS